jgi:hypothetical protein
MYETVVKSVLKRLHIDGASSMQDTAGVGCAVDAIDTNGGA